MSGAAISELAGPLSSVNISGAIGPNEKRLERIWGRGDGV